VGGSSSISTSEEIAAAGDRAAARPQNTAARRTLGWQALRVLALILFTLAYAELFIRVVSPQSLIPRYITGTPWGVRGNIPHARYWHHTPEVDVEYRINGEGMRADRDFPFAKPPGTCRVAVFGDSFLMGYELDLKDTFTARLEEMLRARGFRAEVLNFSVSGFGTAEMLRTYESYARKFDPDVVLFSWHYSDVDDNVRSGLYHLRDGELEDTHHAYLPGVQTQDLLMKSRIYRFISDNSELYTLIRDRLAVLTKQLLVQFRQDRTHPAVASESDDAGSLDEDDLARAAQQQANTALSSALVEHAAGVVARDGKDFYLIEIPMRLSRTKFRSTVTTLDAHVLSEVQVISPLAAFRKVAKPQLKLYYELGHGHFTPAATELLASATADRLVHSRQLSECALPTAAAPSAANQAPTGASESRAGALKLRQP
jgi:hypothetical protein